jgi:hypothetical protein
MFAASLPRQGLIWSSARTSPLISRLGSTPSPRRWQAWAIALRQESSARQWSGRPTSGIGSSGLLFPTPKARDGSHPGGCDAEMRRHSPDLPSMATHGLLPTPTTEDAARKGSEGAWKEWSESGRTTQCRLRNAVHLLPTPNARDWKGAPGAGTIARGGRQASLPAAVPTHGTGGKLHPPFVEWMMGWPIGWTASEPVAMESFRLWRRALLSACCGS